MVFQEMQSGAPVPMTLIIVGIVLFSWGFATLIVNPKIKAGHYPGYPIPSGLRLKKSSILAAALTFLGIVMIASSMISVFNIANANSDTALTNYQKKYDIDEIISNARNEIKVIIDDKEYTFLAKTNKETREPFLIDDPSIDQDLKVADIEK